MIRYLSRRSGAHRPEAAAFFISYQTGRFALHRRAHLAGRDGGRGADVIDGLGRLAGGTTTGRLTFLP